MDSPAQRTSSVSRATDLVDSVKAYALQETVGPMKGAIRWLTYGTAAAVFMGLGVLLVGLGTLRLSQDLGGSALNGSWSFVHYLVGSIVLAAAVAVALSRVSRNSLRRD